MTKNAFVAVVTGGSSGSRARDSQLLCGLWL
ncbi:Uncharacterised protein [Cronobacter sakazakii]|nr:Uncharacterised protein [Cronobacter sakazakii]